MINRPPRGFFEDHAEVFGYFIDGQHVMTS